MIELSTKLTGTAFTKADGGGKQATKVGNKSQASFEERLSQALGPHKGNTDVSEVAKVLSGENGMTPTKDVAAIPSESSKNMPLTQEPGTKDMSHRVSDILGDVNDGQVKLQRLIDLVTNGTTMSPQELIAVQAGVFSLVQELELVGKATQEATQGVRQTINTNVG